MNYIIENKQMRVYGCGAGTKYNKETNKWDRFCTLCNTNNGIGIYMTSNLDDYHRKECARQIKGAKLLYSWERGNYIDDVNGRPFKAGTIVCEIWDFRKILGIEKPLEKCVDYEIYEMLKGKGIVE